MFTIEDAFNAARAKFNQKNDAYGDSWHDYEIISVADTVKRKGYRVKSAIMRKNYNDAEEEVVDDIVYAAFLWCKLQQRKSEGAQQLKKAVDSLMVDQVVGGELPRE